MSTVLRQAILLATKDTRIFFRDRAAMTFAFLLPFVFVIGFSLALRGAGPDHDPLQFTIATQETTGISQQALETIVVATDGLAKAMEYDDALVAVEAGEIEGFIAFPEDFTQRLLSGEMTWLEVAVGDVQPADEAALRGFAQEIAARFSEAQTTLAAVIALGDTEAAASVMSELLSDTSGPAVEVQLEQVGRLLRSTPRTSCCPAT